MKVFENHEFKMLFDDGGRKLESLRLTGCTFDNCGISLSKRPDRMSVVRDVAISKCKVINSEIGPTVLEDVSVEDLAVNPILLVWSSFFRRVSLSGKIGKMNINIEPFGFCTDDDLLARFSAKRAQFYAETDWALDISRAKFLDFSCWGVPFDLVRRDPETQIVVRRKDFPGIQMLDPQFGSAFPEAYTRLEIFSDSEAEEVLLLVPLAAPKKRRDEWAGGLAELRRLGFVSE